MLVHRMAAYVLFSQADPAIAYDGERSISMLRSYVNLLSITHGARGVLVVLDAQLRLHFHGDAMG